MESTQLIKAFTATVQASLHGLESLEEILRAEQDALVGRDPARIEELVAQKNDLLKQLENSVQARDRLQQAAGFQPGIESGSKLVENLALPDLAADWSALTSLARTVAMLNDRNGQLAIQGQKATRTALGIITGRPERDDTYSTLRRKRAGVNSYTLGKV